MHKKLLIVILVLLVVFASNLSAKEHVDKNTPSKFDIGVVMNYSYADLREQNFSEYIPTLRLQMNLLPWLGVSLTGYSRGQEFVSIIGEIVLRTQLGMIEPYAATGPGYLLAFNEDSAENNSSNFAYNFRAGFDVNLTDWFSIGPGITLLIPNVNEFFDDISAIDLQYLKETSLIGLGVKLRF